MRELEEVLFLLAMITLGVMLGYNIPEPAVQTTYVTGTPSYHIDGYLINFKEPSRYGENAENVSSEESDGYTNMQRKIVVKSGQTLDRTDQVCVHEVAHNQQPLRTHPENGTPWFERQEKLTTREVCDKLKAKLWEDREDYLKVGR